MPTFSHDQFMEQFLAVQARVYAYIATLVPSRVDADDLFQQTALVLWRKREQFDGGREFLPWALGIAHNEVRRFFRSYRGRGMPMSEALLDKLAELQHATAGASERQFQQLSDCMAKLTPEQRSLLEQCYLGKEPIKSIAQQRRLDPATLYKRLDRIRWSLMDCIRGGEREDTR